jgi:hypothetical protein
VDLSIPGRNLFTFILTSFLVVIVSLAIFLRDQDKQLDKLNLAPLSPPSSAFAFVELGVQKHIFMVSLKFAILSFCFFLFALTSVAIILYDLGLTLRLVMSDLFPTIVTLSLTCNVIDIGVIIIIIIFLFIYFYFSSPRQRVIDKLAIF